jgi:hypothetical protein
MPGRSAGYRGQVLRPDPTTRADAIGLAEAVQCLDIEPAGAQGIDELPQGVIDEPRVGHHRPRSP